MTRNSEDTRLFPDPSWLLSRIAITGRHQESRLSQSKFDNLICRPNKGLMKNAAKLFRGSQSLLHSLPCGSYDLPLRARNTVETKRRKNNRRRSEGSLADPLFVAVVAQPPAPPLNRPGSSSTCPVCRDPLYRVAARRRALYKE